MSSHLNVLFCGHCALANALLSADSLSFSSVTQKSGIEQGSKIQHTQNPLVPVDEVRHHSRTKVLCLALVRNGLIHPRQTSGTPNVDVRPLSSEGQDFQVVINFFLNHF